jgi:hypothetical protein
MEPVGGVVNRLAPGPTSGEPTSGAAGSRTRIIESDSRSRHTRVAGPGRPVRQRLSESPVSTRARCLWLGTRQTGLGVRRGTPDQHGCNGLKALTYGEPGRHGPRAKNESLGTDPDHASDWGDVTFPVTAPSRSRDRKRSGGVIKDPIPRNGSRDYIRCNLFEHKLASVQK